MSVVAIEAEALDCQRGGQPVISGLSFLVEAGCALILRGPNGSGKTTLLRTVAGYLPAAAGQVRVIEGESGERSGSQSRLPLPTGSGSAPSRLGCSESPSIGKRRSSSTPSPPGERVRVRGDSAQKASAGDEGYFHYIGHANGIKPRLSVIENVSFWQRYYGGGRDIESAESALDAFGLLNLAEYRAAHLSQGQARRLGLSRLLAAHRPVWLLDEPSVSLDAASTRMLERAIGNHLSSGGIAIVSTHIDLTLADTAILELSPALPGR